ncbi:MAG: UMP kinase [Firmicutes bacterium]|nr:UMP kinase [Bacillota bacterium]
MYKRVVLKLSGEAIGNPGSEISFNNDIIRNIISQVKSVMRDGTQVCLVVGGGNIWRGRSANPEIDRVKADQIGMLATVINAIYIADLFRLEGIDAIVQTPLPLGNMTKQFSKDKALAHLMQGRVLIFACGLGHPFFSTDTIAALRAAEMDCDAVLFAKNIDGVYDSDPNINPNAKKLDTLRCEDIAREGLGVIDLAAADLCVKEKIPVIIFGLKEDQGIVRAARGDKIGTMVTV